MILIGVLFVDLGQSHNPIGDLLTLSGVFFVGRWVDLSTERRKNMEAIGIMGFIFGLAALGKIILLEKKLKEAGILKERMESNNK